MREGELEEIEELCSAATPAPWFVRTLDDDSAMNLVAVSTAPDTGTTERWPNFDHRDIIAATWFSIRDTLILVTNAGTRMRPSLQWHGRLCHALWMK
jgi:hypothetical protein